ncbi:hypothetical protein T05_11200, partial [Trichinella murrelli]
LKVKRSEDKRNRDRIQLKILPTPYFELKELLLAVVISYKSDFS